MHVYVSYLSPYVHSASLDLATCGLWDGMESRYKYGDAAAAAAAAAAVADVQRSHIVSHQSQSAA